MNSFPLILLIVVFCRPFLTSVSVLVLFYLLLTLVYQSQKSMLVLTSCIYNKTKPIWPLILVNTFIFKSKKQLPFCLFSLCKSSQVFKKRKNTQFDWYRTHSKLGDKNCVDFFVGIYFPRWKVNIFILNSFIRVLVVVQSLMVCRNKKGCISGGCYVRDTS